MNHHLPVLPFIPGQNNTGSLPPLPQSSTLPPLPDWTSTMQAINQHEESHVAWALRDSRDVHQWIKLEREVIQTNQKLLRREAATAEDELKKVVSQMDESTQLELVKQCRDKHLLAVILAALET